MSDDIDRLKTQVSDLRSLADGLRDTRDALNDVVAAVRPVELETDAEGHVELRDHAFDVLRAYLDIEGVTKEIFGSVALLKRKARLP